MNLKTDLFNLYIKCYIYNNELILYVIRNAKNSCIRNLIFIIILPYIFLKWITIWSYEKILGEQIIYKKKKAEENNFQHKLALVVISKNEGPYIREWIEYHKILGITKIYFYDNESNDDTYKVLYNYIKQGLVEYTLIKGKAQQLNAYNDAIKRHKNECKYMAFIDMDEYLFPTKPFKPISIIIDELLEKAGKGAVGVGVNWAIFGSSHLEKTDNRLITEKFIYRGENYHWGNYHIKTICNPRFVKSYISPHYPVYKVGAYAISEATGKKIYGWFCHSVQYKEIRINHYFTKSKEEFLKKRSRGLADRLSTYDLEMFQRYDLNEIEDKQMQIYTQEIKKKLY